MSALEDAAHDGPIAVGGVSIGAAVSLTWALRHPERGHCGAGRVAGVDGRAGQLACRSGRAVFGTTAARARPDRDDDADAGIQPAVAGRGVDQVVAQPVAGSAGRDGRSGRLRRPDPRAAAAVWPPRWVSSPPATIRFIRFTSDGSGLRPHRTRRCERSRWTSLVRTRPRSAPPPWQLSTRSSRTVLPASSAG